MDRTAGLRISRLSWLWSVMLPSSPIFQTAKSQCLQHIQFSTVGITAYCSHERQSFNLGIIGLYELLSVARFSSTPSVYSGSNTYGTIPYTFSAPFFQNYVIQCVGQVIEVVC